MQIPIRIAKKKPLLPLFFELLAGGIQLLEKDDSLLCKFFQAIPGYVNFDHILQDAVPVILPFPQIIDQPYLEAFCDQRIRIPEDEVLHPLDASLQPEPDSGIYLFNTGDQVLKPRFHQ